MDLVNFIAERYGSIVDPNEDDIAARDFCFLLIDEEGLTEEHKIVIINDQLPLSE